MGIGRLGSWESEREETVNKLACGVRERGFENTL